MTWIVGVGISDGGAREGGSRTSQVRKGEEARTTVSHRRLSGASLQLNISYKKIRVGSSFDHI